ncbi:MAG: TonB-dependent receptor [Muribaculaceae bacterium]|nr:TonB-dependent receptor [Muribaculaceae bacterium]
MLGAHAVPAAEYSRTDSDTLYHLPEFTVSEVSKKEIIPGRTLSGKRLEALREHSVADALRYFSGVQIKDYGGIGGIKTINIRGMGSRHVGVSYNGVALGNAQNGQIDLGRYSMENVESVSVYNGNHSGAFLNARDYASASNVYIRTRRPSRNGSERSHLSASVGVGSFGLIAPEINAELFAGESLSFSASAAFTHADGKYRFRYKRLNYDGTPAYDTTAVRRNGDITAARVELGAYGLLPTGTWQAMLYAYGSERGIPGAIVNNVFRNGERQWDLNIFSQGTAQWNTGPVELRATAKWSRDYMRFLRDDPKEIYLNNKYYQQEGYLSMAAMITPLRWLTASLAVDAWVNTMNANLRNFASPLRFTEIGAASAVINMPHLRVQASMVLSGVQDRARNISDTYRRTWLPSLFLSLHPLRTDRSLTLNAFAKKSMRMPTFNDLYYTEIGNSSLTPEYTFQYSGGIRWEKGIMTLSADAYYNRVTDKIVAYPAGQQFRWTMLNLGRVNITGVELNASTTFDIRQVNINALAEYTFQRAVDDTDPADSYYHHQIPYIPRHSFSFSAGMQWRGFSLNYSTIYTGKRYCAQENTIYNLEQPWYTHDLSAAFAFTLKKYSCSVNAECNNIFGQDYEVIRNYPMPGRNFKITLRIRI